jgi:hypothetical protein
MVAYLFRIQGCPGSNPGSATRIFIWRGRVIWLTYSPWKGDFVSSNLTHATRKRGEVLWPHACFGSRSSEFDSRFPDQGDALWLDTGAIAARTDPRVRTRGCTKLVTWEINGSERYPWLAERNAQNNGVTPC